MKLYLAVLYAVAGVLIGIFLYVMRVQKAAGGSAQWDARTLIRLRLFRAIVRVDFGLCLFAMAAMTCMVLGQEYLFLRWSAIGVSLSRPAAHVPYIRLMMELGGLSVMHFALLLLIRMTVKEIAPGTHRERSYGKKTD